MKILEAWPNGQKIVPTCRLFVLFANFTQPLNARAYFQKVKAMHMNDFCLFKERNSRVQFYIHGC